MNIEIERKFLVNKSDNFKEDAVKKIHIVQGYLNLVGGSLTRIRIEDNKISTINFKEFTKSISRMEHEAIIPIINARNLLKLCGDIIIEKTRWLYEFEGFLWEIDEFHGKNDGLIIAEIEIDSKEQVFSIPEWIGKEVSYDKNFYNINLARTQSNYKFKVARNIL